MPTFSNVKKKNAGQEAKGGACYLKHGNWKSEIK